MNPRKKKIACDATAILMVPPASFTPAITADPRKDAPFEKISYRPKYSPELSGGMILEKYDLDRDWMDPWKHPTPNARKLKPIRFFKVSAYRQTIKYPAMHTRISCTVSYFFDNFANTSEPPKATTCVASSQITCPTVLRYRSVPILIQLSIIVPTPSM